MRTLYRTWGKIRWIKLSRIPPIEVFTGKLCGALHLQHLSKTMDAVAYGYADMYTYICHLV